MWSISKRKAAHAAPGAAAAWYRNEAAAFAVADRLNDAGIPGGQVSMVGRKLSSHAELQGYYDPGSHMNAYLLPATLGGAALGLLAAGVALLAAPQLAAWGAAALPSVLSLLTLGLTAGAGVGAFASWIACLDAAEGAHARYTRRIHAGHVLVAVHGAPNQPGLMDRARRVLGRAGEAEHGDHENSDAR